MEFAAVSILYLRFKLNPILSLWLFWTLLGIPAYFLFINLFLGYEEFIAIMLPLKEAVHGLLNVTLASLLALTLTFTAKNRVGIVSSTTFSIERNPKIGMPAQSLVELRLLSEAFE